MLCNNQNELKFAEKYLINKGYKINYDYEVELEMFPLVLYNYGNKKYLNTMEYKKFNTFINVKLNHKIISAKQLMREKKFKRLYD